MLKWEIRSFECHYAATVNEVLDPNDETKRSCLQRSYKVAYLLASEAAVVSLSTGVIVHFVSPQSELPHPSLKNS